MSLTIILIRFSFQDIIIKAGKPSVHINTRHRSHQPLIGLLNSRPRVGSVPAASRNAERFSHRYNNIGFSIRRRRVCAGGIEKHQCFSHRYNHVKLRFLLLWNLQPAGNIVFRINNALFTSSTGTLEIFLRRPSLHVSGVTVRGGTRLAGLTA